MIAELGADPAPEAVRRWCGAVPAWLVVRRPNALTVPAARVHPGEAQAIALASEARADRRLIDDRAGRAAATAAGLRVIGTLGVLDYADRRALLELPAALDRLESTNFRAHPRLLSTLRDRAARRRGGRPT